VPKSVPFAAEARQMLYVDATCPLVSKVHVEAQRHADNGLQMIMIGHAGHPETVGTMGQLPPGEVLLVETPADVARVQVRDPNRLAFVTQTTLSVDDTADIVTALQARFPTIVGPHKEDICYATTNRQEAVKAMAAPDPAVLHTSALLFNGVKFAGVAYLLYLAWQALRAGGALAVTADSKPQPLFAVARRGTLINLLNPKLSIFFLALLPPFLSGSPATATLEMLTLGAVFMIMTFAIFVLYGLFAGAARRWILASERTMRWLNRGFAGVFALLAGRLALERA
jgi:threonine/homoserine/homoserine lactone efflux protein